MREIVQLQVGACGNNIGEGFWQDVNKQHGIDASGASTSSQEKQVEKIKVFYKELKENKYQPRAVVVDLDPENITNLRSGYLGKILPSDHFIAGEYGCRTWPRGHYTDGAELLDSIMESIHKEVEECDCLQGFQMFHSLGGGTGSGLGSLLLENLLEHYPSNIQSAYSVVYSRLVSDEVIEPYNAVLALSRLIENSEECFLIDNESLYNIVTKSLEVKTPSYKVFNHNIVPAISSSTYSLRFPSQLNSDLRKRALNLVPFPEQHFLTLSFAPLTCGAGYGEVTPLTQLTQQIFDVNNSLSGCDIRQGHLMAASGMYHGPFSSKEIDDQMSYMRAMNHDVIANWMPDSIKLDGSDITPCDLPTAASLIANTTSIKRVFSRIRDQFWAMYKRKAFLHGYTRDGMDWMEFDEALAMLDDLIDAYTNLEVTTSTGDEGNAEEESTNNDNNTNDLPPLIF